MFNVNQDENQFLFTFSRAFLTSGASHSQSCSVISKVQCLDPLTRAATISEAHLWRQLYKNRSSRKTDSQ